MPVKRLLVFCVLLLLPTLQTSAQTADYSLRDLATANDLYIGTAAWAYHLDDETHQRIVYDFFNMLTPEHEAKFCVVQNREAVFDFRAMDRIVNFAESLDLVPRGHTLLWHQCEGAWLTGQDLSRDQAIDFMRDHIYTVVGRYKGRIAMWDVVNEAIDGSRRRQTQWQQWIGDDWIDLAFQFAHEADPDALLFYNDYGAEGLNAKSDAVYELVSGMVERGVPIHGVGLQMHITAGATRDTGSLPPEALAANMQRLGELGLDIHITEMDVNYRSDTTDTILQRQAADYRRVLEVCLDSEYCKAFITWGVTGRYSWLRGRDDGNPNVEPLLFDNDYSPQPAYFAILDLLARRAGFEPVLSDAEVTRMMGEPPPPQIVIPPPSMSDPDQLAPDPVPGLVYYAPTNVTITLDGETDDWANVPRVSVDEALYMPDDAPTAFDFAVAADNTHLYFLAEVRDGSIVQGLHPTSDWWQEDGVEFYLNTTSNLEANAYAPGIVQIGILAANITGPETPLIGGGNSADAQVEVVAIETEEGYLIEAAVPLETDVWNIEPDHEGVLGFQAHLNSASVQDRDAKMIWSLHDTEDQSYANPSLFGQLIFWDVTS